MSRARRARILAPGTGSGGAPPPAVGSVAIGPDYGESSGNDGITMFGPIAVIDFAALGGSGQLSAVSTIDLAKIDPVGTLPLTTTIDLDKVSPNGSLGSVATTIDLAKVDPSGGLLSVSAIDLAQVDMTGALTAQALVDLDKVDMAGALSSVSTLDFAKLDPSGSLSSVSAIDLFSVNPVSNAVGGLAVVPTMHGSVLGAPFWQREDHIGQGASEPITVTYAAGAPADGTFLLAWVANETGGLCNIPTGWTDVPIAPSAGNFTGRVMYKFASGEGTTQDFDFPGSPNRCTAEIHQILGVDTTTPINITANGAANVTDPVVPSVTTTVPNCLVFYFCAHDHLAITQSHTPPASNTERTDFEGVGLARLGSTSGTRIFAATGATGTATINCNEIVATQAIYIRVAIAPGSLVIG